MEVKAYRDGGAGPIQQPHILHHQELPLPRSSQGPLHPPAPRDIPEEMPYLEVADHGEACRADPAGGQPQSVEEGRPKALQEVGVAQQPHQDD